MLTRLAALLGTNPTLLAKQITPCSPKVPAPCSTGQPYAPVTVASKVPTAVVLAISEHREQFPGVAVETVSRAAPTPAARSPRRSSATPAHVTAADDKGNPTLNDEDTIGRGRARGAVRLRCCAGPTARSTCSSTRRAISVGAGRTVPAAQGDTLVTSIDAHLQALAEHSLAQQIRDSRKAGKPAPSGSVVIMDPNTGRILASASYPTYDPSVFIGGISDADYTDADQRQRRTPRCSTGRSRGSTRRARRSS